jgi:hypothetical protein
MGERAGESTGEMGELRKPGDPMGEPGERTTLQIQTDRGRGEDSACIFWLRPSSPHSTPPLCSKQISGLHYVYMYVYIT